MLPIFTCICINLFDTSDEKPEKQLVEQQDSPEKIIPFDSVTFPKNDTEEEKISCVMKEKNYKIKSIEIEQEYTDD